ncbi:hypothetical protein [Pseudomonas phage D6]|nr:hypothetical protein [Pseudomonas phage D6]
MFNPNKPVYQIGIEDGGGGWHRPHRYHPDQLTQLRRELEEPQPVKMLQLELREDRKFWSIGNGAELSIDLSKSDYQPVVNIGESFTIKVLDLIIECEKCRNFFAITKITTKDGAVFNTLQVPHTHKLATMLRVTTLTPVLTFYA